MQTEAEQTEAVVAFAADELRRLVQDLCLVHRMPPAIVLLGMQLELAVGMAQILGGPRAALEMEKTADRVRNLPSVHANSLAFAPPAGRA